PRGCPRLRSTSLSRALRARDQLWGRVLSSRNRALSQTARRGSPCSRRSFSSFARRLLRRLLHELDPPERILALDDAERAVATLLLDEVVERPRLLNPLGHVRRDGRRHLPAARKPEREL